MNPNTNDLALIQTSLGALSVERARHIEAGDFLLSSRLVDDHQAALNALSALDGPGWAWFAETGGIVALVEGKPIQGSGPLECAERASADGKKSVSIALDGCGQWRITTAERTAPPPESEGLSLIVHHHLLRRGGPVNPPDLRYEVLWQAGPTGPLRPVASRFLGFGQAGPTKL